MLFLVSKLAVRDSVCRVHQRRAIAVGAIVTKAGYYTRKMAYLYAKVSDLVMIGNSTPKVAAYNILQKMVFLVSKASITVSQSFKKLCSLSCPVKGLVCIPMK